MNKKRKLRENKEEENRLDTKGTLVIFDGQFKD